MRPEVASFLQNRVAAPRFTRHVFILNIGKGAASNAIGMDFGTRPHRRWNLSADGPRPDGPGANLAAT